MDDSRLLQPLADVRRRLRRIVVSRGLIRVLSAAVLIGLTCVVLDWFLWLPAAIRLTITLFVLVGAGFALWHLVARPWLRPIDLTEVAIKVQDQFPQFHRGLAGAVEFVQKGASGSAALAEQAVARAAEIAAGLRMHTALAGSLAPGHVLIAVFAVATTAVLGAAAPGWLHTGALRFADPLGQHEWPRRVEIRAITGDKVVAFGEGFTCEMAVIRGASERLRAAAVVRDESGRTSEVPLQRGTDGVYRWTFEGVTRSFTYWFRAGDATTGGHPSHVRLVVRPAVRSVELVLHPPPYASELAPTRHVLSDKAVQAMEGSRAIVEVATGKPIEPAPGSPAGAWLIGSDDGKELTLSPVPGNPRAFTGTLAIDQSATFHVHLVDGEGFANRDPQVYRIEMVRDRVPSVALLEPPPVLEATPIADVPLTASVEDDFGIAFLTLHAAVEQRQSPSTVDLMPATELTTGPGRVVGRTDYRWSLRPLELTPGQIVTYRLEAGDNFELAGRRHEPVSSRTGRLKIVSDAELAERLADRLHLLDGQVRQLWTQQETLRDELASVAEVASADAVLSEAAAESLLRVSGEQSRLAARTGQTGRQFADLSRMLELNGVDDPGGLVQTERFSERLGELADGPMTEASELAAKARLSDELQLRGEQLAAAGRSQHAASDALRELLAELDRWGNLQDVVRKTRETLDRQQQTTRQTARLTARTIGKRAAELSAEQLAELEAQAKTQDRLAGEVTDLVRKLPPLAEALRENDAASADALATAERTARSAAVADRMQAAADAIRANRGSSAGIEQLAAEKGLQDMLASLEDRRSRVLAELTKKLEEAEQVLLALIAEQGELLLANASSRSAADRQDRYTAQAGTQDLLKRRTQKLAGRLAGDFETAETSRLVRSAVPPMTRAALRLTEGQGPEAETDQHVALDALEAALDTLQEQRRKAEAEEAARSLLAFRQELVEIRDKQATIGQQVQAVADDVAADGVLSRLEARTVRRLAHEQESLKDETASLQARVAETVVYDWAIGLVVGGMGEAAGRLASRDLSAGTVEVLAEILAQLDQLIESLIEEGNPPEDEFASGGAGGGADPQHKPKGPVPTLAELRLLKMLQLDLNRRTKKLAADSESADVSEETLSGISDLGKRQKKIRELAEKMIERTWLHEVR